VRKSEYASDVDTEFNSELSPDLDTDFRFDADLDSDVHESSGSVPNRYFHTDADDPSDAHRDVNGNFGS
jgi:hypothetical protein